MDLRYERSIRPRYGAPLSRAASPHFVYGGPSEPNVSLHDAESLGVPLRPSGAVGDTLPAAQPSDPIKLTSKNYVVGFLVGALIGAGAMHLSMKSGSH